MNNLTGHIAGLETSGDMSIVSIGLNDQLLMKAIVIETPETADYLKEGKQVSLLFKETEVILGTGDQEAISLENKIPGTVKDLENGTLLSKVIMDTPVGEITAIISSLSATQLGLKVQTNVSVMIKINEVMLSGK